MADAQHGPRDFATVLDLGRYWPTTAAWVVDGLTPPPSAPPAEPAGPAELVALVDELAGARAALHGPPPGEEQR